MEEEDSNGGLCKPFFVYSELRIVDGTGGMPPEPNGWISLLKDNNSEAN